LSFVACLIYLYEWRVAQEIISGVVYTAR